MENVSVSVAFWENAAKMVCTVLKTLFYFIWCSANWVKPGNVVCYGPSPLRYFQNLPCQKQVFELAVYTSHAYGKII